MHVINANMHLRLLSIGCSWNANWCLRGCFYDSSPST